MKSERWGGWSTPKSGVAFGMAVLSRVDAAKHGSLLVRIDATPWELPRQINHLTLKRPIIRVSYQTMPDGIPVNINPF